MPINIPIRGEDQLSPAFKSAVMATDELQGAIKKLLVQEDVNKTMAQAQSIVQGLTADQKKMAMAVIESDEALKKQKESAAGSKMSLTDLKSGIDIATQGFQAFTGVFKEAFEAGKQGAAIRQTADSFAYLVDKVKAYPDLLDRLRSASQGTVDDMTLMSATTTLLAGAQGQLAQDLANATPQLMEMAKAAQKLNPSLGDTTFLYESLATGIKRGSPMILDNLGITIKIGEANEKYAAAIGKTAEELTSEEAKQALLNATLEAGNVLIEQAGGNAISATDNIARMEASIKNLSDTAMSKLAPSLANAADAITLMVTGSDKLSTALATHNTNMGASATSYEAYIEEMTRAARAAGFMVRADGDSIWILQQKYGITTDVTEKMGVYTRAQYQNNQAVEEGIQNMRGVSSIAARGTNAIEDITEATKDSSEADHKAALAKNKYLYALERQKEQAAEVQKSMEEMTALQQNMTDASNAAAEAQDRFNESFGSKAAASLEKYTKSADKYREGLVIQDEVLGTNMTASYDAQVALDTLNEQFATNKIGGEEYARRLKEEVLPAHESLDESLQKTKEAFQNARIEWDNFIAKLGEANGQHFAVVVDVQYSYGGGGGSNANSGSGTGDTTVRQFAQGGQFIVPPGYSNDSYMMTARLSSGERVTVETASDVMGGAYSTDSGGMFSGSGGGDTYVTYSINASISGDYDVTRMMQKMETIRKRRARGKG